MSQLPAIRKEFWPERQMTEQRSETQELGEVGGPCSWRGRGGGRSGVSQKGAASTGGKAKSRELKLDASSLVLSKKATKGPQKRKKQQLCNRYKSPDATRRLHQLHQMCPSPSHLGSVLDPRPWGAWERSQLTEEEPDLKLQGEWGRAQILTGYKSGVFILLRRWNFFFKYWQDGSWP